MKIIISEEIANKLLEEVSHETTIDKLMSKIDTKEFKYWTEENGWDEEDIQDDFSYVASEFLEDTYDITINSDGYIEFLHLNDKVSNLIGNLPVIVVHYTSSSLLNSIKKNGLIPGFHKTNPHGNSYSGVYVMSANSPHGVKYSNIATNKHGGQPIAISIITNQSQLSTDLDDIDLKYGNEQYVINKVLPSQIYDVHHPH